MCVRVCFFVFWCLIPPPIAAVFPTVTFIFQDREAGEQRKQIAVLEREISVSEHNVQREIDPTRRAMLRETVKVRTQLAEFLRAKVDHTATLKKKRKEKKERCVSDTRVFIYPRETMQEM